MEMVLGNIVRPRGSSGWAGKHLQGHLISMINFVLIYVYMCVYLCVNVYGCPGELEDPLELEYP